MSEVKRGYKQTEVGVIPEDWEVRTLGELGQFKNGMNKDSAAFGHGSPFVNLMDVFGVCSISKTEGLGLVACSSQERASYDLRQGDVLFVRSSVKPSGVGLTAVVMNYLPDTVYSGFLIRFRDCDFLDVGYKRHCFYDSRFRRFLVGSSSVSANTNISQDSLKALSLAIPRNRAEQEAIAEALSDADALIESLEQLLTKKRQIKQGAMQELLTGKKRLHGFVGKWKPGCLGDVIAALEAGVSVNSSDEDEGSDQNSILKTSSVVGGRFLPYECKTIVSRDLQRARLNPRRDTILVSRMNTPDLVGECGYVDTDYPRLFVPDRLWLTRFSDKAETDARWLAYTLSSPRQKVRISAAATGTSGSMKNLSKQAFLSLTLDFPAKNEQAAIASVLSDMDAEISALETKLTKAQLVKQGMMQNLLTGKIRLV